MAIWAWAAAAYARPGVAERCLSLQDDHGQCVSFLLWAAHGGVADPARLAQGAQLARGWEQAVLTPLRAARRGLKSACPPMEDAGREALRAQALALELAAERMLLEALDGLPQGADRADMLEALEAASKSWEKPAPVAVLADLAAALG